MDASSPAQDNVDLLRLLADNNGVSTGFWDWYGNRRNVSVYSLLRVLNSLGVPVTPDATVGDVQDALTFTEDQNWLRTLPDCVVARQGDWREIAVHVPDGSWVHVDLLLEDGRRAVLDQLDRYVAPREVDGRWIGRATFQLPGWVPLGWHRLVATIEGGQVHSAPVIVVPQRLDPEALRDGRQRWGVSAQIYSVRSDRSWGIGDSADLTDVVAVCADKGADFLLINPVHASSPVAPMEDSPYLPVTRRWVNPIYVRPETIEEYASLPEAGRRAVEELRLAAVGVDSPGSLIDRDRAWEAKRKALELIFAAPRSYHRQAEFQAFIRRGGEDLANFALWSALVEQAEGLDLPEDRASSVAPAVNLLRAELADRIEFWTWCQWVARVQLASGQRIARELGMDIGIMADLAVGVHAQGSEVWSEPEMFAPGMTVGAPPDMYSQQGQDWSQPPWSPRALAKSGYRPLRDMVRAVLAQAGAVRIDHILGLFRLWWIPEGASPSEGTYVYFDHEAMVGVVMLEAQRAGAVVIGEDLGTVEPWVRDYLGQRGILGTSVLWFEKEPSGWPLHADQYRRTVLSTVNTHDLPPTSGYLEGIQSTLRDQLGLLVEDVEAVRAADKVEQERMLVRLREYGILTEPDPSVAEVVEALHRYITRTSSQLVGVSLVDAVGDKRPQNLPGTNREYPNWCVPLTDSDGAEVKVEDLATNRRLNGLFDIMEDGVRPH